MPAVLAPLRRDLDFMPSPVEDRPGLLIRDSLGYSDAVIIIPPQLVQCLSCFDGQQSDLDLRQALVRLTGELQVGGLATHLIETLQRSAFLEDETFAHIKEEKHHAFAEATVREPAHSGSGYPDDPTVLREQMNTWLSGPAEPASDLIAIAAPHVSPSGGYLSYQSAYSKLGPEYRDRTFVILGTSHYGEPDRFGLTRKPYATPWGNATTNVALIDELTRLAPDSIATEDYFHSVEHSIEFQVVYLQSIFGPDIRIVPILCGSYARSIYFGGNPEDNEQVKRFLGALGDIAAREGNNLLWVLGIDMAHIGRRYGDPFEAIADEEQMLRVRERDHLRIDRMLSGDATGFWDLVQENRDDLKWCGSSPVYTFLRALPHTRGQLHRYEQWNIDPSSCVTFAGLSFR